MNYNYHTHTYRCNHASGTEREYIEQAISVGIKKFGFSDHIPFIYPHGKENSYRVPKVLEEEYIAEILRLGEDYKDKIEIYVGYETEYYPKHFDDMVKEARQKGAQYLILGQHSVGYDGVDLHWTTDETDDEKKLSEYVNCVISAMESGYITYVAHPDIFNFTGDDETYEKEMTRLIKASAETKTPLEINFLGIRDNRHYPNEKFWKLAGRVGCQVVFGFDAHDVLGAGDIESLKKANEIVRKYKLDFIENPILKAL